MPYNKPKTWRVLEVEDELLETNMRGLRDFKEQVDEMQKTYDLTRETLKDELISLRDKQDPLADKIVVGGQAMEVIVVKRKSLKVEKLLQKGVDPQIIEDCTEETQTVQVRFVQGK